MTDKAKEIRAAYYREYRRKNPEKTKESVARYWERKAQKEQGAKDEKKNSK